MAYYNRKGEKLQIKTRQLKYINEGQCAKVYQYEDIIFKKYLTDTSNRFRLDPKVFDVLKTINNKHFIELYDIYNNINIIKLYQNNNKQFIVDAYTAKYYENNQNLNILYNQVSDMLDHFKEIEELFNIFSENEILVADVKKDNTINSSDGIIIIDPDCFSIVQDELLYFYNKRKLLMLLRSFYIDELLIDKRCRQIYKLDNSLLNFQIDKKTDITYELSLRLKK